MSNTESETSFPSSPVIERAVLAMIMVEPNTLDMMPEGGELFHEAKHRLVFDNLVQHRPSLGARYDVDWLCQRLIDRNEIEKAGGFEYVQGTAGRHQAKRIEADIAELRDRLARRLQIAAAQWAISAAMDLGDEDFNGPMIEGCRQVTNALEGLKEEPTMLDLVTESMQRFQARLEGKETPMGIETLVEIDRLLKGLHPGRVWVIGAYPSGGKSVLGSQMLGNVIRDGFAGLYITLEMMTSDQVDRMIIQLSGASAKAFSDPVALKSERGEGLNRIELSQIKLAGKTLVDAKVRLVRPQRKTLGAIVAEIRAAHRELGARVAVIDYLQLVRPNGTRIKGQSKEEEVSDISHMLQEVAQETGMHLILLSQLNADGETKHGRVIEEDADAFLVIEQDRKAEGKPHLGIRIVKDRHNGNSGTRIPLVLDKEKIVFTYGLPPERPDNDGRQRTDFRKL